MNNIPAYGLWGLVIINSLIFIIFAFSFTKPLIVAIIARIIKRNGLNKRVVLFRTAALGVESFKTFFINNNTKSRFNPMQLKLKVLEMSCGGCLSTIAEAIKTVDANAIVHGDPQTKIVLVETEFPETVIKTAIAQAGYPAS